MPHECRTVTAAGNTGVSLLWGSDIELAVLHPGEKPASKMQKSAAPLSRATLLQLAFDSPRELAMLLRQTMRDSMKISPIYIAKISVHHCTGRVS
jgi:hypothetical protein